MSMNPYPSMNAQGQYAAWDGRWVGNKIVPTFIGYIDVVKHRNGILVARATYTAYLAMEAAAKKEGIILDFAAAFRTWDDQMRQRKKNVIYTLAFKGLNPGAKPGEFNTKQLVYLETAPSSAFSPVTAIPGTSNHQDGKAIDFNTSVKDKAGKVIGYTSMYPWLVKNAWKFGFVRTVPTEGWHWEYRGTVKDTFQFVERSNPTWFGLS